MWIAFGQGKNIKWMSVHELSTLLSPKNSLGLLFFHAFTGCDSVSAFRGKGKKSAWQTWEVFPDASEVFQKLSWYPTQNEGKETCYEALETDDDEVSSDGSDFSTPLLKLLPHRDLKKIIGEVCSHHV